MRGIENRINAGWAAKYPFTEAAREYVRLFVPPLDELASESELRHVWDAALERALNSIKGKSDVDWRVEEDELVATSYPIALAIVKATKNPIIYSKFANGEAKRAFRLLLAESPDNLVYIAGELGLRVRYLGDGRYSVHFMDYLVVAVKLAHPRWKLVNNYLINGQVILDHKRVCRMIAERVREYVLRRLADKWEPPQRIFSDLAEKVITFVDEKIGGKKPHREEICKDPNSFPPCIRKIYQEVKVGGNPPHTARFALTSFMLRAGFSEEEVVGLFTRAADYRERIAKYQVEHIAGKKGGRKKYMVPSCEKMRIYGLCVPEDDNICRRIKNPIQYPAVARKIARRGK